MTRWLVGFLTVWLGLFAHAQDAPAMINAENVELLRPVWQFDMADNPLVAPARLFSGQFALSDDGDALATVVKLPTTPPQYEILLLDLPTGDVTTFPLDSDYGQSVLAFAGETLYWTEDFEDTLFIYSVDVGGGKPNRRAKFEIPSALFELWQEGDALYLEVADEDYMSYVVRIDMTNGAISRLPYLPARDEEAVVRIGRVPLPYVVTSSEDGRVKLWNVSQETLLAEVNNTTGQPSVFGNVNASANALVWRDNANENLYLLDFANGENRIITALNDDYVQWFFLTPAADVVLAVGVGGLPNVVAWDVATGTRYDLGDYRPCARPQPDMARLSADGTTLVVGCDAGFEAWRVGE
jgi:hypothetical protein